MNDEDRGEKMNVVKGIQNVITVVLVGIIAILLIVFFIPQCLGYQPYNVQTGSMEPNFPIGSMIYVKATPLEELNVGDVVTFRTAAEGGWIVTHRISQIDKETATIVTKGDANNTEDGSILYSSIIGRAANFAIPKVGGLVTQYQNGNGKLFTIVGIVTLLGISFVLDRVGKRFEEDETV